MTDPAAAVTAAAAGPAVGAVDLVGWFAHHGRDLPWRRTRDPWAVMVAELMLQQTQVARVADRWGPFLDRFPSPAVMAAGPIGAVIGAWAGLGYNRRAANLHRAAVVMVERYGGRVPEELGDLLALPGIGAYTARAVRVFAFEHDDAVVDTNVVRILSRVSGRRVEGRAAQEAADALVPPDHGWTWNQAMLDVGAICCRAREPRCAPCPFAPRCRWRAAGRPDPDPGRVPASRRQGRFEGSDRQGRGRLVDAVRRGPVPAERLAEVMGWPDDPVRADRVAAAVVADGLVERTPSGFGLPGQ
ncbi:MAG: A/G-specific adenine glycosylase [Acidimicrobiales bacterium]